MEKEQLSSFKQRELIHNGESSRIYRLGDGRVLKVAKDVVFESCKLLNIDYEAKISDTRAHVIDGIVCPLSAVYSNKMCVGYTMDEVKGKSLNEYDENYTLQQKSDLDAYFRLYTKIEELVARANKLCIVMPDLCTCDNIIFTPEGKVKLIDYDGMQIGNNDRAIALSTSLGDPLKYVVSPKYVNGYFHFTKELDKTSLTILMFLWIFNVNLLRVGEYNPYTHSFVSIKDVFDLLGIEDETFMKKVDANLSLDHKGSYLSDDLYRITQRYDMMSAMIPGMKDQCIKKLIKK